MSSSTVWRRAFAVVFSVLLVTSVVLMPAGAQSESEQWARIFGGEPGGAAFGLTVTDDGLLVAGQQWESLDTDNSDATLVHLDRAGEPVWIGTYRDEGSDGWERATNVVETNEGYVFTGGSGLSGWVVTTDADGVLTVDALADAPPVSLGGGRVESWATNVRTTEDGYVVVGGAQRAGTTDSARTLLVEYDDRLEVTATVVPGIFGEYGIDVVVVDDGYVVLSERTSQLVGGDAVLRKVTPEGGVVWERVYGGQGDQTVSRLASTPDGGFVTAGSTDDDRDGEDDAWLVKFDGEGTIEWERTYERTPGNDDTARTVVPTSDGGYVLAGQTTVVRGTAASSDGWLVKTDGSGAMEWERSFGGAGSEGFNDVVEVEPGVYGVAGFTRSYAPTVKGWILQVDGDADPADDETVFVPTAIDGSDVEGPPGATQGDGTEGETTDTPDDGAIDGSGPGFGVGVVVLAVLLVGVSLVSRRRFGR